MTTIKPGSRPSSKFDYDPSVSCQDNPNPPQCEQGSQETPRHSGYRSKARSNRQRVPCLNFYNQSDSQLLWWQKLRQEAVFNPEHFHLYSDNHNECTNHTLFHFYIHNRSNETTEKYDVEWQRGDQLLEKNDKNPDVINVCYADNQTPMPSRFQWHVVHSFKKCLLHYGQLVELVVNYPATPN